MTVRVKLLGIGFAAGRAELHLDVGDGASLNEALYQLWAMGKFETPVENLVSVSIITINGNPARPDSLLQPGDELHILRIAGGG